MFGEGSYNRNLLAGRALMSSSCESTVISL